MLRSRSGLRGRVRLLSTIHHTSPDRNRPDLVWGGTGPKLEGLIELDLGNTYVKGGYTSPKVFTMGADGARLLAEALETNTTIQTLKLTFNDLGDEGASYLADALAVNDTLVHLVLADNAIGSLGVSSALPCTHEFSCISSSYFHWARPSGWRKPCWKIKRFDSSTCVTTR